MLLSQLTDTIDNFGHKETKIQVHDNMANIVAQKSPLQAQENCRQRTVGIHPKSSVFLFGQ